MYNQQNIQATLSNIQNRQIREQFNRNGFYRAIVVSNDDPLMLGRVKVRIPALHGANSNQLGYMEDSVLPFAFPGIIHGAGYNEGQYLLPSVGHTVWVSFETGTDNLIYFGGLYSENPESDKYVYKGRDVNNGVPLLVAGRDLPNDYSPDKHVVYRTAFGDIIYIDDRAGRESIVVENRYGNKITLEKESVVITSKTPLSANFPYMHISYCDSSNIKGLSFKLPLSEIFTDTALSIKETEIFKGALVLFIKNEQIKGTGIIVSSGSEDINVKLVS